MQQYTFQVCHPANIANHTTVADITVTDFSANTSIFTNTLAREIQQNRTVSQPTLKHTLTITLQMLLLVMLIHLLMALRLT